MQLEADEGGCAGLLRPTLRCVNAKLHELHERSGTAINGARGR